MVGIGEPEDLDPEFAQQYLHNASRTSVDLPPNACDSVTDQFIWHQGGPQASCARFPVAEQPPPWKH